MSLTSGLWKLGGLIWALILATGWACSRLSPGAAEPGLRPSCKGPGHTEPSSLGLSTGWSHPRTKACLGTLPGPPLGCRGSPRMPLLQGKNTGMGCHFLLQVIFPIQGSNLHLLVLQNCRYISYPLSYWGSPLGRICVPKLWLFKISAICVYKQTSHHGFEYGKPHTWPAGQLLSRCGWTNSIHVSF